MSSVHDDDLTVMILAMTDLHHRHCRQAPCKIGSDLCRQTWIKGCGELVQHEDARLLQDGPCHRQSLGLTSRQSRSSWADDGAQTAVHPSHLLGQSDFPKHLPQVIVAGIGNGQS